MILIKRHKILAGIMAFLFLAFVSVGITQQMGYFPFNGNTFKIRSGATQTVESGGALIVASGGTFTSSGILNSGKFLGFTAAAAWSDTAGWSGPKMFIFTAADTLYMYTAAHTIKKFPGL